MLKVVVAYDGSPQARKALDRLSWWPVEELKVLIVSAVAGPALNELGDAVEMDPQQAGQAIAYLNEACAVLQARGIMVASRVVAGDPADVIVQVAAEENADLIVTGSRGHNLAKRMFLGSVSTDILHHASCAVLLVH